MILLLKLQNSTFSDWPIDLGSYTFI